MKKSSDDTKQPTQQPTQQPAQDESVQVPSPSEPISDPTEELGSMIFVGGLPMKKPTK